MPTLGSAGAAHSDDCAFEAFVLFGVPIRVSYMLILLMVWQLQQAWNQAAGSSPGYIIGLVGLTQVILFLTILVHEFGHGTMAKQLGGSIKQIFLWPLGGICFSTRPPNVIDAKTKVKNELKIVVAGPATHFLQIPFWMVILSALNHALCDPGTADRYNYVGLLNPLGTNHPPMPREYGKYGLVTQLTYQLVTFAISINVFLFVFNVFFPMYPMDSAKILVCSLQLCGVTAYTAAWTLIFTSVPMCLLLLLWSLPSVLGMGRGGGGGGFFNGFFGCYLATLGLGEAYKIYQLIESRQLHTHHVFELARSETIYDPEYGAHRNNPDQRDDDRSTTTNDGSARSNSNSRREPLRLFGGSGRELGT